MIILPIFFRVASLALGQLYHCRMVGEMTWNDMGKIVAQSFDCPIASEGMWVNRSHPL